MIGQGDFVCPVCGKVVEFGKRSDGAMRANYHYDQATKKECASLTVRYDPAHLTRPHPLSGLTAFQQKVYDATGLDRRTARQIRQRAGLGISHATAVQRGLARLFQIGLITCDAQCSLFWRTAL